MTTKLIQLADEAIALSDEFFNVQIGWPEEYYDKQKKEFESFSRNKIETLATALLKTMAALEIIERLPKVCKERGLENCIEAILSEVKDCKEELEALTQPLGQTGEKV